MLFIWFLLNRLVVFHVYEVAFHIIHIPYSIQTMIYEGKIATIRIDGLNCYLTIKLQEESASTLEDDNN